MISIKVLEGFSETLIFSWAKYYLNRQLVWFRSEGSISVTWVFFFFSFFFQFVTRNTSADFRVHISISTYTHVHDWKKNSPTLWCSHLLAWWYPWHSLVGGLSTPSVTNIYFLDSSKSKTSPKGAIFLYMSFCSFYPCSFIVCAWVVSAVLFSHLYVLAALKGL